MLSDHSIALWSHIWALERLFMKMIFIPKIDLLSEELWYEELELEVLYRIKLGRNLLIRRVGFLEWISEHDFRIRLKKTSLNRFHLGDHDIQHPWTFSERKAGRSNDIQIFWWWEPAMDHWQNNAREGQDFGNRCRCGSQPSPLSFKIKNMNKK